MGTFLKIMMIIHLLKMHRKRIIRDNWTFYDENGILFCYWPDYIRSEHTMLMTLRENFDLELSRCLVCPINVKYRSSSYEKAKSKLKILEEQTNVSQTSDDADDVRNHTKNTKENALSGSQRRRIVNSKYNDDFCDLNSSSDEDKIPAPPTLKYDNPKQDIRRADILKKSKLFMLRK
ncbi:hypothetical protein NQ314_014996 [Rhamnusium bicolor]|uniref:Uncharacterized protein n=1 Tax=Rhamnusium bicolor TaxID=1586634 RepID=A0AAV8X0W2_9CUCU|nr:hypothetical protein NQ314_014996 [Rhamnusium bicolor]